MKRSHAHRLIRVSVLMRNIASWCQLGTITTWIFYTYLNLLIGGVAAEEYHHLVDCKKELLVLPEKAKGRDSVDRLYTMVQPMPFYSTPAKVQIKKTKVKDEWAMRFDGNSISGTDSNAYVTLNKCNDCFVYLDKYNDGCFNILMNDRKCLAMYKKRRLWLYEKDMTKNRENCFKFALINETEFINWKEEILKNSYLVDSEERLFVFPEEAKGKEGVDHVYIRIEDITYFTTPPKLELTARNKTIKWAYQEKDSEDWAVKLNGFSIFGTDGKRYVTMIDSAKWSNQLFISLHYDKASGFFHIFHSINACFVMRKRGFSLLYETKRTTHWTYCLKFSLISKKRFSELKDQRFKNAYLVDCQKRLFAFPKKSKGNDGVHGLFTSLKKICYVNTQPPKVTAISREESNKWAIKFNEYAISGTDDKKYVTLKECENCSVHLHIDHDGCFHMRLNENRCFAKDRDWWLYEKNMKEDWKSCSKFALINENQLFEVLSNQYYDLGICDTNLYVDLYKPSKKEIYFILFANGRLPWTKPFQFIKLKGKNNFKIKGFWRIVYDIRLLGRLTETDTFPLKVDVSWGLENLRLAKGSSHPFTLSDSPNKCFEMRYNGGKNCIVIAKKTYINGELFSLLRERTIEETRCAKFTLYNWT